MADYPLLNDTGVYINTSLVRTFHKPLTLESFEGGSAVLYDLQDHILIDGEFTLSEDKLILTFLPEQTLTPNTSYTWAFGGLDDPDVFPVQFEDGSYLENSVFLTFQTGADAKAHTPTLPTSGTGATSEIEPINGVIKDGQTIETRDSDTFKVESTTPVHLASGVYVEAQNMEIVFNSPLKDGQDLDALLSIKYEPILRETHYYNKLEFNQCVRRTAPGQIDETPEDNLFRLPTGSWTLSVDKLTATWIPDAEQPLWNANAFVIVTVSKELLDENDNNLNSSRDECFYFLTELYPMLSTMESVLLHLSAIQGSISEEVVLRLILKYSYEAWLLAKCKFSLLKPPIIATEFVECATVIALIDSKTIQKEINRGKSIKLADLSVEYDFPRDPASDVSSIRNHCSEKLEEAKKYLTFLGGSLDSIPLGVNLPFDVYRNRIHFGADYVPPNIGNTENF